MEAKHTPGPWLIGYGGQDDDDFAVITSPHSDRAICNLEPRDYVQANARLIAAAPDLLAALEIVCARLNVEEEYKPGKAYLLAAHRKEFNELLAKARGEADPITSTAAAGYHPGSLADPRD